jgi:hypothetical protein
MSDETKRESCIVSFQDDDPLEVRIWAFEAERDRVVAEACSAAKKKEAQEFYDKLIAGLKERGHVCTFNQANGCKCPTCGEEFGAATPPVAPQFKCGESIRRKNV